MNFFIKKSRVLSLILMLLFFGCAATPEKQTPENESTRYFERALAAEAKGLYHAAIGHYTRYIQINQGQPPYLIPAYNNRGTAYWKLGRHKDALNDFDRAAKIGPEVALTFINMGNVHADMGQIEKAVSDYTRAIELDPENGLAYSNRGLVWSGLRRFDMALPDFDRAIELGHPGLYKSLMKRGVIKFGTNDFDGAIQDFSRVIKLTPNYAEAYFYRGQAYKQKNQPGKAQKDMEKALQLRRMAKPRS